MKYSWIYCDTSAFLKLYVKENGSGEARKFARKNRLLSSAILLTECYSALSRKKEMGEIKEDVFMDLAKRLKNDFGRLEVITLKEEVLQRAEDIALHFNVRALDALHIASALIFHENSGLGLSFLTSDKKQANAAKTVGLKTFLAG